MSDIDLSTAANDPRPSASFLARKNPQCIRIPVNTPPVFRACGLASGRTYFASPATQRGNKKPLVTIDDHKRPFVAVRLMSPLLYQLSYTGLESGLSKLQEPCVRELTPQGLLVISIYPIMPMGR